MEAEKRTKTISKLADIRVRGADAGVTLRDMAPVFDEMRRIYNNQLVQNTKRDSKPDEFTVYLLVALADLERTLELTRDAGQSADKKLEKIRQEVERAN